MLSRYVDAWHVMNLAVDPAWRRRGIAVSAARAAAERDAGDTERGYTLEVRVSNDGRDRGSTSGSGSARAGSGRGYYTDNREDALIMWRDSAACAADEENG